jgi:Ribbon-helix-helix domain
MRETRIIAYVTKEQAEQLREESLRTGAPVSELVRRALNMSRYQQARGVETR